jgi:hypothetical protein
VKDGLELKPLRAVMVEFRNNNKLWLYKIKCADKEIGAFSVHTSEIKNLTVDDINK